MSTTANNNLEFIKLVATGNDFILFDATEPHLSKEFLKRFSPMNHSSIAQMLCKRHDGVGADGFIILSKNNDGNEDEYVWDFYNSDGSIAEMCGNATRTVGYYVFSQNQKLKEIKLKTKAGIKTISKISLEEISTDMGPIKNSELNLNIKFKSISIYYDFINTGVPHYVLETSNTSDQTKLRIIAHHLRNIKNHSDTGCNVTFFEKVTPQKIKAVTFERGVENFTQSCGTGAVAACYSHLNKLMKNYTVSVDMPGGHLKVEFKNRTSFLMGPAKALAKFQWLPK